MNRNLPHSPRVALRDALLNLGVSATDGCKLTEVRFTIIVILSPVPGFQSVYVSGG